MAAVNCDEDSNKPFCGKMGVQGFPTLKIVKPGSNPGNPIVEDYQGPRTAKGIVEAIVDKIPNHVQKVQDAGLDNWLNENNGTAKAVLFTDKGTTSAMLKAVAIDFLGSISIAQIRSKEASAVEMFGVKDFPSLVLLPGGKAGPIAYVGEMKKDALVTFLGQVAAPNADPAPKKMGGSSSKKTKSSQSAASSFSKASESHKSADASDAAGSASTIVLEDIPTNSPQPIVPSAETPGIVPDVAPPIPTLSIPAELKSKCLAPKSGTCVLVLLPAMPDVEAAHPQSVINALGASADIVDKHVKRQANFFPFYAIPAENEAARTVRGDLGLTVDALDMIAVNMKRGWWRRFTGSDYETLNVENFVDAIKLGECGKEKLPESFFVEDGGTGSAEDSARDPMDEAFADIVDEGEGTKMESAEEPLVEPEPEVKHGEL